MSQVFLIGQTQLGCDFRAFTQAVGWKQPNLSANADPDILCEAAGRLCYKAYAPYDGTEQTNPNVTRIREGNKKYIRNIADSGHGSVFEHANFTFAVLGISRVFTHELVRHRAGCAYSQESMRYVRLQEFDMILPEDDDVPDELYNDMTAVHGYLREAIACMNSRIPEDASFDLKKKLTSFIRRAAPIGVSTNIIFTANVRALRHMIAQRTSVHAETEIRDVFMKVARACLSAAPNLFCDMDWKDGVYTFANDKV